MTSYIQSNKQSILVTMDYFVYFNTVRGYKMGDSINMTTKDTIARAMNSSRYATRMIHNRG